MEKTEREQVLHYLADTREMLIRSVDRLTAEQQFFRSAADRWSVADCVEHVTVVETNILKAIQRTLQGPPDPNQPGLTQGKDRTILEMVPSRQTRVKGPDAVMPNGRWPHFEALLLQFEAARERSVRFAAVTQADLRAFAFPHPFLGPLDCYQWLLFLAAHCERHVHHLQEVKTDAAFPRTFSASV